MAHTTLRKPFRNFPKMPPADGPRPETVQALLNFSKALKIVTIPPVGKVGVVLN